MSSFSTYLIGYIIFVIGLAVAAFYLNAPPLWIGIGLVVLIGFGIMMATQKEKPRDPPKV
jgi:peptidoglycan/LPS O-acetylase OafA/YrhL